MTQVNENDILPSISWNIIAWRAKKAAAFICSDQVFHVKGGEGYSRS